MDSESFDNNNVVDNNNNNNKNPAPVAPEIFGKGLPYAPENFPNPGDIWSWRSGKRIAFDGSYRDRYLYLPPHLPPPVDKTSYRGGFTSKAAVKRYVEVNFPNINVDDLFNSFSWKIPSDQSGNMDPKADLDVFSPPSESDVDADGCKAGDQTSKDGYLSKSLILEAEVDQVLEALRKSHEFEYNLAGERINAQKKYLQDLRQQFEREKFELANAPNPSRLAVLLETVFNRNNQLKQEVLKFEEMKKIANGFGSISKDILEKHFGL